MSSALTKTRFRQVVEQYRPTPFESFGDTDKRFRRPMHYVLKNRDRFYAALRSGLRYLPPDRGVVIDFGPYPGSLLRLLRALRPEAGLRLVGAGLMTRPEFSQLMKEDCGAEILTVNLDPLNGQFRHKSFPLTVPLAARTVHLAFALEIIEHLASPYHLLAEAYRVLARGGHLVVTTPNVTRIGNLFKLLVGRSPHDRLAPPGYHNPEDEWQPHAREYAMYELAEMLGQSGFEVVERRHFLGEDTQHCVQPLSRTLADLAKLPFYAVPHLRGSLLIVGKKPE